jgi:uncharacterized protein DUF6159
MFDRLSRSWALVKASASVLSQDKHLLLFPLISAASVLLVIACFAVPMFGLGAIDAMRGGEDDTISALGYVVAFLFYFSQYFVIFFFNTALVGAAMMRLDGGNPSFSDGMRIATSKIGIIAGYALIAATVGMILRAIQERVGFIGRIIVGLIGIGWTLATYLVVPVLAARDVGPIEAIKESATLFKKTWGESVIGQAGMGLAFGFMFLGVFLFGVFLVVLAILAHSVFLIVTAIVLTILALVILALVSSALGGIYAAALYRYATTGKGSEGFDSNTMKLAFAPKK